MGKSISLITRALGELTEHTRESLQHPPFASFFFDFTRLDKRHFGTDAPSICFSPLPPTFPAYQATSPTFFFGYTTPLHCFLPQPATLLSLAWKAKGEKKQIIIFRALSPSPSFASLGPRRTHCRAPLRINQPNFKEEFKMEGMVGSLCKSRDKSDEWRDDEGQRKKR